MKEICWLFKSKRTIKPLSYLSFLLVMYWDWGFTKEHSFVIKVEFQFFQFLTICFTKRYFNCVFLKHFCKNVKPDRLRENGRYMFQFFHKRVSWNCFWAWCSNMRSWNILVSVSFILKESQNNWGWKRLERSPCPPSCLKTRISCEVRAGCSLTYVFFTRRCSAALRWHHLTPTPGRQISAGCCGSCSDKPTGQVHHSGAYLEIHTVASAIHNSTAFNVLSKEGVFQALHKVSGFWKNTLQRLLEC